MFEAVRETSANVNQTLGATASAAMELGDTAREVREAVADIRFMVTGCVVFVVIASVAVIFLASKASTDG